MKRYIILLLFAGNLFAQRFVTIGTDSFLVVMKYEIYGTDSATYTYHHPKAWGIQMICQDSLVVSTIETTADSIKYIFRIGPTGGKVEILAIWNGSGRPPYIDGWASFVWVTKRKPKLI